MWRKTYLFPLHGSIVFNMLRAACLALLATSASAFVPHGSRAFAPVMRPAVSARTSLQMSVSEPFDAAMGKFKSDFPFLAEYGWGPSTKAERWNGRHAMAGWVFIVLTGYVQSHGIIPDAEKALDPKARDAHPSATPPPLMPLGSRVRTRDRRRQTRPLFAGVVSLSNNR